MIVPSQFSPSGRDEAAAPFSPWRKGFRIGGCIGVLLVSLT